MLSVGVSDVLRGKMPFSSLATISVRPIFLWFYLYQQLGGLWTVDVLSFLGLWTDDVLELG